MTVAEGWYLASTAVLERAVIAWREGRADAFSDPAIERLTIEEALSFRDGGNLPDELDRTLRLVLVVDSAQALTGLAAKRAAFEPDHLDPPTWRVAGSRPVNVVPLRPPDVTGTGRPWWDDPEVAALEAEWRRTGRVGGLVVSGDVRGFVFKTVIELRHGGREVTVDSIAHAVERWLSPVEAARVREALSEANG